MDLRGFITRDSNHILSIFYFDTDKVFSHSQHIMKLKTEENNLDAGRFINYRYHLSSYNVFCSQPYVNEVEVPLDISIEVFDWISENVNHCWSFDAFKEDTDARFADTKYVFYFENVYDAGYFALRWR